MKLFVLMMLIIIFYGISSENATVLVNKTHTTGYISTELIMDETKKQGWECRCWISTNEEERECRCEGPNLLRMPQTLKDAEMQRLTIAMAGIEVLRGGLKVYANSLQDINLTNLNFFHRICAGAFRNLSKLRTIYISHAPNLIHLDKDTFLGIADTLRSIRIIHCGLLKIPDMSLLPSNLILHMVDLDGNQIIEVDINSVRIKTEQLILDNNALVYVNDSAFSGSEIAQLSFKGNYVLKRLHKNAFLGIKNIRELDLSNTAIEELPTNGLADLEVLRIQNAHSLKTIPSVYNFKNLQEAWLTHSFHCCAFKFPSRHDPARHAEQLEKISEQQKQCIEKGYLPTVGEVIAPLKSENILKEIVNDLHTIETENYTTKLKRSINSDKNTNHTSMEATYFINNKMDYTSGLVSNKFHFNAITGSPISHGYEKNVVDDMAGYVNSNDDETMGEFHEMEVTPDHFMNALCGNLTKSNVNVKCYPMPDALNPCEDVMGSHWLRGSVWIVVLLAVFGNISVLIVLFSSKADMTVPKFLMCHLSFADLCMGLYLLLIASIDAHSMGEYFNFAFDWQYGSGCKVAGFLTVFASHLSVFTLTIITLERWFAITHAIYLNKRIKIKAAVYIMVGGWTYALTMASLPLFGISNYSSTSICLPMEARDVFDISYLITVLAVNGLAFMIICICYALIYCSLGHDTTSSTVRTASRGEMTVAKKMALLVFTNFACWSPIAFFGLTAIAGYPLIDVTKSKILLVFFYPINSCANPYLYAILTSQYRKDLFMLLSKHGFCTKRAQQYKLTYSNNPTNTIPMPLIGRQSSQSSQRKTSRDQIEEALLV